MGERAIISAYAVALRINLLSNVAAGLGAMSAAFGRTHADARRLQGILGEIKTLGLTGAVAGGMGFMGLGLIAKTLPHAKEYAHQLAQMNIAGMKQAEIARSISAAWATTRAVPTTTATSNLQAIRDLQATLGTNVEAVNFLPTAQRLAYILQNTAGTKALNAPAQVAAAGRALDIRNATTDPRTLAREADLMTRAIVGSQGQLTATNFNTTLRLAGSVGKRWSEEFTYRVLPSLMQEQKSGASGSGSGGGPAAGLVSAAQAIVAGRISKRSLTEFMNLGLVDPGKVLYTTTGAVKGVSKGGIVGSELFQADPYMWAQKVLLPAMTAAGITTKRAQGESLEYLFGNRTAARVMSTLLLETRQIERDRGMFKRAAGLGAYDELIKKDPLAADAMAAAQWKNLMTVIGIEILPMVTRATLAFTRGLQGLAKWARENPNLTKGLVVAFGALSAAMAFGGTVILLTAAFKGLGLALGVMGVGKLFAMAKGVTALGQASLLFPTIGELMVGFATTLGGVAATIATILGPIAAFGAAGASVFNGVKYQKILANPGAASSADRAWALDYANRNAANYGSMVANKQINAATGRRFQEKWGGEAQRLGPSPYVAPAASRGGGGTIMGDIRMDGRKVGDVVAGHLGKSMGFQSGGSTGGATVPLMQRPFKQ